MRKSIFFWLYFVTSIILAVYFAARIITSQMGHGPVSNVRQIEIITNSKDVDVEPIKIAIGVTKGTNIKTLDLYNINHRVMNVPGIKKASTRKLPNGNLVIKTEKHDIVAMWTDGSLYYPLSVDGTKIDTPTETPDANTLVFTGELPDNLKEIISNVSPLSEYIDHINMIESRRWNIHTKNGTTIYLPENNVSVAINKISVLNQTHKILSRELEVIDMRDNARILVQTRK